MKPPVYIRRGNDIQLQTQGSWGDSSLIMAAAHALAVNIVRINDGLFSERVRRSDCWRRWKGSGITVYEGAPSSLGAPSSSATDGTGRRRSTSQFSERDISPSQLHELLGKLREVQPLSLVIVFVDNNHYKCAGSFGADREEVTTRSSYFGVDDLLDDRGMLKDGLVLDELFPDATHELRRIRMWRAEPTGGSTANAPDPAGDGWCHNLIFLF